MRPFSQACENNKEPIARVLDKIYPESARVLEIGSGTGQHGAYFSTRLPKLVWQTSDVVANHPGIRQWVEFANAENLLEPLELDVMDCHHWTLVSRQHPEKFDGAFSANTAHIMPWVAVNNMIAGVAQQLKDHGVFVLYGPFNRDGQFTSDSNRRFHHSLTSTHPHMGIRNDQSVIKSALSCGLDICNDIDMPANNRCLIFQLS